METKICGTCKEEKEVCNFGRDKRTPTGFRSSCNECRRDESRKYREKNPEKRKETIRKYYIKNKEAELLRYKKYRKDNPDKRKETTKKYYKKNKIKINQKTVYWNKIKYKTNSLYRLIHNLRIRTKEYLRQHRSSGKTFDVVGCTPDFLKSYLESKFMEGMSWDNYGYYGWHIDHITPLSSAKTKEEVYKLCHYTNLQPLWAYDNLTKGNKLIQFDSVGSDNIPNVV